MLQVRVIPTLLLSNKGLVKTVQFENPRYVGDPINAVKIFNEKEVDEIALLDIEASREKKGPDFDLIAEIASECFMPFAYGGGISSLEHIKELFRLGAEKIVLNTQAVENPDLIKLAAQHYGSQSIVIAVDVRKTSSGEYEVFTRSGKTKTGLSVIPFVQNMEDLGAGEILLTAIDREGTQDGYDLDLIKKVTSSLSIPVIACGGAGKLEDFREAVKEGASAVAAGSFFVFHGVHKAVLITYPKRTDLNKLFSD